MADRPELDSTEVNSFKITASTAGARLDQFLALQYVDISRTRLQKIIQEGLVTVNGDAARTKYVLRKEDVIEVTIKNDVQEMSFAPMELPLDILFEDEDIIVVNKSAGVVVHPGAGDVGVTLAQGLLYYCQNLSKCGGESRPGIVHRLDKGTTGVIVVAKNDKAHAHLSQQFYEKSNYREYWALLDGFMKVPTLSFESYVGRDPNNRTRQNSWTEKEYLQLNRSAQGALKFSRSHFRRIQSFEQRLTLASVQLETGRTHQIRVHAKELNMNVIGDATYGRNLQLPKGFDDCGKEFAGIKRQMLHARYLGFVHPTSGEKLAFEAPLPDDFRNLLLVLDKKRDL